MDPPDHQPTQEEFGGWPVEGCFKLRDHDAYRAYQAALKHWNQYHVWGQNRSPVRAEPEHKLGYDTVATARHLTCMQMA